MGDASALVGSRTTQSTMYHRSNFGSITMSPPLSSFRSDAFGSSVSKNGASQSFGLSRSAERNGSDRSGGSYTPSLAASTSDPAVFSTDSRLGSTILIRRLPRNIGDEAVRSMLIFAADLLDTEFVRSPYLEDQGYSTAVARFQSSAGAQEAQQKLHGKPNTARDANMIVEIHSSGMPGSMERRATIDGMRQQTGSTSSSSSNGGPPQQSAPGRSRFGSTFQSTEKISPPLPTPSSGGSNEFPPPDSNRIQNLFSPQSPLSNGFDDRNRVSGKSVINNDHGADDETGDILKDPLAYARNGQHARRATNPQIPVSRFGSLSLSTPNGGSTSNILSPSGTNIASPRGTTTIQSPLSPTNITNMGPNGAYNTMAYPRPQYPPVNPADQNPPCNTLYVGNLPMDTSEDELKTIFSKQRGYKRLCFRSKTNGPMCFVEFEDISFATKALNELYGHPLHNSIKGGIRLSFSKNPLGVRSGQANGMMANGYGQHPAAQGYGAGIMGAPSFSAVSGPPPGLSSPSGLMNGNTSGYRQPSSTGMDGMFSNPFGMPQQNFADQLGPRHLSGGLPPNMSGQFNGRDHRRPSYNDYTLGRS